MSGHNFNIDHNSDLRGDFEELLRKSAEDYGEQVAPPSPDIWNNIQKQLPSKQNNWYKRLIVLALLFMIAGSSWYILSDVVSKQGNNMDVIKLSKINNDVKYNNILKYNDKDSFVIVDNIVPGKKNDTLGVNSLNNKLIDTNNRLINNHVNNDVINIQQNNSEIVSTNITPVSLDSKINDSSFFIKELVSQQREERLPASTAIAGVAGIVDNLPRAIDITLPGNPSMELQTSLTRKSKFDIQFYITPSVSYRKWAEQGKNKIGDALSLSSYDYYNMLPAIDNYLGANNVVDQSPMIGWEAGSVLHYPVTKRLALKGGVQLNWEGYNIKAYEYHRELANVTLSGNGGLERIDEYTSFRNKVGYAEKELRNRNLEIAIPMGVDATIANTKAFRVGIGVTIQPSYLLYNKSYLLSDDYNNYIELSSLARKWNLAAGAEVYISFPLHKGRGTTLQLGPQLRYQLLSNYKAEYPIKERLMNYGFKIGITKPL